jgi:hypothetical protein
VIWYTPGDTSKKVEDTPVKTGFWVAVGVGVTLGVAVRVGVRVAVRVAVAVAVGVPVGEAVALRVRVGVGVRVAGLWLMKMMIFSLGGSGMWRA